MNAELLSIAENDKSVENHEGPGGIYVVAFFKPSGRGKPQLSHTETVEYLKEYPRGESFVVVRLEHGGQVEVPRSHLTLCTDAETIKAFHEACKDPFNVNERVKLTETGIEYVFNALLKKLFVPDAKLKELIIKAMHEGKGFRVVRILRDAISIEVLISLPRADLKKKMEKEKQRVSIDLDAVSFLVAERIKK